MTVGALLGICCSLNYPQDQGELIFEKIDIFGKKLSYYKMYMKFQPVQHIEKIMHKPPRQCLVPIQISIIGLGFYYPAVRLSVRTGTMKFIGVSFVWC